MKRLTMMLTGLLVAFCATAEINSRSYVQQGLVAQYDGINNVGHDAAHSSDATTWVDLTGHGNDATKAANVTWAANGWVNSADCYPMTVTSRGISAVTATKVFTIEFATTPSRHTSRQCFFGQYSSRGFSVEHNSSGSRLESKGFFRLYYYFDGSPVLDSNYIYVKQTANEWASMSVASDTSRQTILKNGEVAMSVDKPATGKLTASCNSVIGGDNSRVSMAFRGTYNAFRLYDRVLAERESKINAAVDAVRFNNADWNNDYPELACYSFDASGNLQKSLLAVASENGSVKIGDGAAAASAATEAAAFGSGAQTATFTAVPASGYVFYRWEGDTDAIASGTVVTPTVTVTADKGARLIAVFKAQPIAYSSRSYVQDGLVAQYDGIKNVSHDAAHDTSTTTWADLTGNGANGACVTDASAGFKWGENGWSVTNSCRPVTVTSYNLSQTLATGAFTIQFACTPDAPGNTDKRMVFFGEYSGANGDVNVEQTAANQLRLYRNTMAAPASNTYDWKSSGKSYIGVGKFFSVAYTMATNSGVLFVDGTQRETSSQSFITARTNTTCYIGGEQQRPAYAFRGTYNAFRLYNRVLTDEENLHNAFVDAVRFANGASLPAGYVAGGDGALKVTVSATATAGGKVSIRGGSAASSVSANVDILGSDYTYLEAFPEEGYVFDRWTGDTSAITEGHPVAARIAVDPSAPVTLKAVFRKPGNALDGMIFDLDIRDVEDDHIMSGTSSEYHVGDALKAGSSSSNYYYTALYTANPMESRPKYRIVDVPTPITPFTTNAAQPCIYTPQTWADSSKCNVVRWELPNNYVDGPVATFYVRFLWEGPTLPGNENRCCILCNGYNAWADVGRGFVLRLHSLDGGGANDNKGFVQVFVPNHVPEPVDSSTDLYVTTNSWVDCFVSVYPSTTNVERSNADVWFCQMPALGSNGVFGRPVLKHKHFGDECELPRFKDVTQGHAIRFGAESSGTTTTTDSIRKAFRGYYAAIKAWNRVLSENEMWSVMAGRYGGTFNVGVENGNADEFGSTWYGRRADPFDVATNKWQEMKKSLTAEDRTLTLTVPIPAESENLPRVLEVVPLFDGVGASCPVLVTANGVMVGEFDLMDASKRAIPLRGNQVTRDANGKLTIAITRPEGCAGTLSFDALSMGGSWQIGTINGTHGEMTREAEGVSSVVIAGDPNYKHAQRSLTTTYNTLTIPFNVPKSSSGQCAYRYETYIDSLLSGTTHPIHLELNGEMIWSSANVTNGKVSVDIPAESVKPGLNELKLVYDTTTANSWLTFDYHRMKMILPTGMVLIIR